MAAKQTISQNISKIPKGIGVGLAVSIATTMIGSAVGAWLLVSEKTSENSLGYIALILLLLSSILGALATVGIVKEKRVPVCLLSGVIYLLSLLAVTALFFGGTYGGVGESALVVLGGALSVALLGLKGAKKPKRKKIK